MLIKKTTRLEREGSEALATRKSPVDGRGHRIPGEWWVHPGRAEIQKLYSDALHTAPPRFQGRVLKGYVAHHPEAAWDPNSWFVEFWWELRSRRDGQAKILLKAIAAGIQAPADLGMPRHRAKQRRLAWARSALKGYWRPHVMELRNLLREYRTTRQCSRRAHHAELAERATRLRNEFVARIVKLTGYQPTPLELEDSPLSAVLRKAASLRYGVSERALHDRPHKSVAFR